MLSSEITKLWHRRATVRCCDSVSRSPSSRSFPCASADGPPSLTLLWRAGRWYMSPAQVHQCPQHMQYYYSVTRLSSSSIGALATPLLFGNFHPSGPCSSPPSKGKSGALQVLAHSLQPYKGPPDASICRIPTIYPFSQYCTCMADWLRL